MSSNECGPASTRITDLVACRAAAAALARTFGVSGTFASAPRGCYSLTTSGAVLFNMHATGAASAVQQLVCYTGTAAPTNVGDTWAPTPAPSFAPTGAPHWADATGERSEASSAVPAAPCLFACRRPLPTALRGRLPGRYAYGGLDSNTCPINFVFITSGSACSAAAAAVGLSYGGSDAEGTFYPRGCYRYTGSTLYYNTDPVGGPDSSSSLLCTVSATGAPTMPTPAPTEFPTQSGEPILTRKPRRCAQARCLPPWCRRGCGGRVSNRRRVALDVALLVPARHLFGRGTGR